MLHIAKFEPHKGKSPALLLQEFIAACNLHRNDIINVQETPEGNYVLFYWQDLPK